MAKKILKKKARNSKPITGPDRISELPDPIIYHILSFVPTLHAVRMSVLSRRWRRVWYSVSTLRFSDVGYRRRSRFFEAFVENCLMHRDRARRYIADADVTRLKLDFHYGHDKPVGLKKWLSSAIVQNCVKELEVCAEPEQFMQDMFKHRVVVSGRALVTVKLEHLRWEDSGPVSLPSLKCLNLTNVAISGETLNNIVSGCRCLEKCVLKHMYCGDLRFSSSSLEILEVRGTFSSLKVEASNLRSLVIGGYKAKANFDFSGCWAIRDLSLSLDGVEKEHSIEDQISKLTRLENLSLIVHEVYGIRISSPSLKTLAVSRRSNEELKIATEAPNLVSFSYEGSVGLSMLMESPNHQLDGLFIIARLYWVSTDWYGDLISFLSKINCSWNSICLHVCEDEDIIVPKSLRTGVPPFPNVKHLKLVSHGRLVRKAEMSKSLHWIAPSLETLSIGKCEFVDCIYRVARR